MRQAPADILAGEPLGLGHRAEIEALLAQFSSGPSFSELSFANLFLFRHVHRYRVLSGPTPGILGTTYDGRLHALPLCPLDDALPLLEQAEFLYPVAEGALGQSRRDWRIGHADADSDYLYSAESLSRLPPSRRSQADRFAAESGPEIELEPEGFEAAALSILDLWSDEVGKPPHKTDLAEFRAAIEAREELGLQEVVVRSHGVPCGFLLTSSLPDGSRAVHFAKASRRLPGAYPWMFSRYARICGSRFLNFEQDLGKDGLQRAKTALDPVKKLVKFRLEAA